MQAPTIDGRLVTEYLDRLYGIGALPSGGVWRPVYSRAWDEARALVRGWLEDAGLAVREDAVGNVFGRLEGSESGRVVMVGSHIDTVYAGGRLDGALGVVGAIAAVRALMASEPGPRRTVEVFVSCEEEDSRFVCDFWGSRAVLGQVHPGEAERYRDVDGVRMGDAMRGVGLDPARVRDAARNDLAAFLELHIEQGPVLEREGVALGVVEAISGLNRIAVTIAGKADHAGTTPIALRSDALLAAARVVERVRELADRLGEPARATVGRLFVRPNQPNIVPGSAELIVDCRHPDRARQERLSDDIRAECARIGRDSGVEVTTDVLVDQPPTAMDPQLARLVDDAIRARGLSFRRMVSGAGHDSQILGRAIPAAMIFVPSHGGRSHSPAEHTPEEQLMPGVQALADALLRVANEDGAVRPSAAVP